MDTEKRPANPPARELLSRELDVFEQRRAELLERARGKYVLIKGDEVAGFFALEMDAVNAGWERYGLGPFLVKQVLETDPVHQIPTFQSES